MKYYNHVLSRWIVAFQTVAEMRILAVQRSKKKREDTEEEVDAPESFQVANVSSASAQCLLSLDQICDEKMLYSSR